MGSFVSKNVRCGLEVNQPGAKGMPVISGSDGVMTLAVSSTGTGTGTITLGDNRCRSLSLFRCSVKGST